MKHYNWAEARRPLFIAAVVIALSFTPFRIVSMLACVGLWGVYWPFGKKRSIFFRFVIGFVLMSCFQQVLGMVFWLAHLSMTIPAVVTAQLLVVAFLYLKTKTTGESTELKESKYFAAADYIALFVTGMTVLGLGIFILHPGASTNTLLRFDARSADSISHLDTVWADYNAQGYAYGTSSAVKHSVLDNGMNVYPQGWHLSASLWWRSVSNSFSLNSVVGLRDALAAFLVVDVLWYALLIYLLCRLILYLGEKVWPKDNNPWLTGAAVTLLVGFVQVVWSLTILRSGFCTFTPQLVYLLVLLFFVGEFLGAQKQRGLNSFLISGALLTSGMSLVWLLATPLGVGAMLLALIMKYDEKYRATLKRLFFRKHIVALITAVIILGIGSLQLLVYLIYPHISNALNLSGGIYIVSRPIIIAFALLSVGLLVATKDKKLQGIFVSMLPAAVLLTGLVYCFQIYSTGKSSYYYVKLAQLVFMLVFVFGGAALIGFSGVLAKRIKNIPAILVFACFILFLIFSVQPQLTTVSKFLKYDWAMTPHAANGIISLVSEHKKTGMRVVLITDVRDATESNVARKFVADAYSQGISIGESRNSPFAGWGCSHEMNIIALSLTDKKQNAETFNMLAACSASNSYEIIAPDDYKAVQAQFGNNKNIHIIPQVK